MSDQQRRTDTFLRGLLTGAVVGAVIAGSTLWERRRRKAGATAGATDAIHGGAPVQEAEHEPNAPGARGGERPVRP